MGIMRCFGWIGISTHEVNLFNYHVKPDDFYYRLENNIKLNKEYAVKIFSLPMKYIPVTDKNRRDYVIPFLKQV